MNGFEQREILISNSKIAMKEYGSEFYNGYEIKDYDNVTIEEFIIPNGNYKGEKVFVVSFYYENMAQRELNYDQVFFWDKTGKPYSIQAGISTLGKFIDENLFNGPID
jgi:hypothetical protein